jgi:hypothetical protein
VRISPLSAFKNFVSALSPSLSCHHCDFCLAATFQVCFRCENFTIVSL